MSNIPNADKDVGKHRKTVLSKVRSFLGDQRGVAALEFAIIVPLLCAFYFVTLETGQALDTNKKLSRVASMVGDLVAQQPTMTVEEVTGIMEIGASIMQPYRRSTPSITVTAIEIPSGKTPKPVVAWERKLVDGKAEKGRNAGTAVPNVPAALNVAGSYYIRAQVNLTYRSILAWGSGDKKASGLSAIDKIANMQMEETYYLLPRQSATVPCTNCN